MKQYINTRRLAAGRFFATTTVVTGLILLIISSLLSLTPQIGAVAFPVLIMGVAFSTLGIRLSHQWTRAPYTHDVLGSALKGLPADSALIHYWKPAAHLLLTRDAVYVLIPFRRAASIVVATPAWRDNSSLIHRLRRLLALDTLAHTIQTANTQTIKTSQWMEKHFPGNGFPIYTSIVFTNSAATLRVIEQTSPIALYADKRKPNLKALIRNQPNSATPIPTSNIASLIQTDP